MSEALYVLRAVAEDGSLFYVTKPISLKELQHFIQVNQVGGEICACGIYPLAKTKVEIPRDEIVAAISKTLSRDEEEGEQADSADTEESAPPEPPKEAVPAREKANGAARNAPRGRGRRSGVSISSNPAGRA